MTTEQEQRVSARDTAVAFGEAVVEAIGDRVESITLFGSVARGEYVRGVSDVNVLVLVDRVDAPLLGALSPCVTAWRDRLYTPPLLMDRDGWGRARDVFAIEVADMADAREVLKGADPAADVVVDAAALRVQAERELRIRLLHLHQRMLAEAGDPIELGRLLVASLPSLATYLRAVLRMNARPVPPRMPDVARNAAEVIGTNAETVLQVIEARNAAAAPEVSIDAPLLAGYHQFVSRTLDHVDRFGEGR